MEHSNTTPNEEHKQTYASKLREHSVKMVYPSLQEIDSDSDAEEEDEFKSDQSDSDITPHIKRKKILQTPSSSLCYMENGICSFPSSPRMLESLINTAKKNIDFLENEYIQFYSDPPSIFGLVDLSYPQNSAPIKCDLLTFDFQANN